MCRTSTFIFGPEGPPTERLRRIWLFVIAITLHNFPEGLAVAFGFGTGDLGSATALAIRIGLQNIPGGLGGGRGPADAGLLQGTDAGRGHRDWMVEPVGGWIGVVAVTVSQALLPWGLAFAAGNSASVHRRVTCSPGQRPSP